MPNGSPFNSEATPATHERSDAGRGDVIVFAVNATPLVRHGYRLGVPGGGFYREIINTDAETYGGSNVGNMGGFEAEDFPWQGRTHSLMISLPPLATVASCATE